MTLIRLALLLPLALPAAASAAPCPAAMPVQGEYSSGFGGRRGHPGVDLRAPVGSRVQTVLPGTVVFAGRYYAYGLMVEIRHADGSTARYAHLGRFAPGISAGARVEALQAIGAVGRTGRTTGAHLHVELRRGGRATDPWPWLTQTACIPWNEVAEAPR